MREITFKDRVRYHFDNMMSKGPIALIGWLFISSAVLIALISLVVVSFGLGPEGRGTFLEVAWASLMRTLDAGTMGGDEGHWPFLLAMLIVTFGGIFIVSILIGVLTTGIEGKLEQLRKGRSFVAEQGHTVILGWSSQIFTLISEIIAANANQKRSCIVILAEKDTVEMQDEISSKIGKTGRTRVVCRTGSPIEAYDAGKILWRKNKPGQVFIDQLYARGSNHSALRKLSCVETLKSHLRKWVDCSDPALHRQKPQHYPPFMYLTPSQAWAGLTSFITISVFARIVAALFSLQETLSYRRS